MFSFHAYRRSLSFAGAGIHYGSVVLKTVLYLHTCKNQEYFRMTVRETESPYLLHFAFTRLNTTTLHYSLTVIVIFFVYVFFKGASGSISIARDYRSSGYWLIIFIIYLTLTLYSKAAKTHFCLVVVTCLLSFNYLQ